MFHFYLAIPNNQCFKDRVNLSMPYVISDKYHYNLFIRNCVTEIFTKLETYYCRHIFIFFIYNFNYEYTLTSYVFSFITCGNWIFNFYVCGMIYL